MLKNSSQSTINQARSSSLRSNIAFEEIIYESFYICIFKLDAERIGQLSKFEKRMILKIENLVGAALKIFYIIWIFKKKIPYST